MPKRAHDKHGAFIILVCVFIAADSIVKGKEAHGALCIESQHDIKEHWGRFRRPGSSFFLCSPSRQLSQGLSVQDLSSEIRGLRLMS